jgi:hypothetical protein
MWKTLCGCICEFFSSFRANRANRSKPLINLEKSFRGRDATAPELSKSAKN